MVFPSVLPDWFMVTLLLTVGPALLFAFAYLLLRTGDLLRRQGPSGTWLLRLLAVLVMAAIPAVVLAALFHAARELDSPTAIISTTLAYVGGAVLVVNWFGGIFAPTVRQGHFDQAMADQTKTITDAMDDQTKTIVAAIDRLVEVGRERDERMISVLSEVLEELRAQRTGNDVGDAT